MAFSLRVNCRTVGCEGSSFLLNFDLKEEARRELLRALRELDGDDCRQLIWCHDDNTIETENFPQLELTRNERTIVQKLEKGRFSRDEMLECLYPATKLQKMRDPKKTMRKNICKLNETLEKYGLFIETDSLFYHLKKF